MPKRTSISVKSIVRPLPVRRARLCAWFLVLTLMVALANYIRWPAYTATRSLLRSDSLNAASLVEREAYIVLCTGDKHALPALVLFHRLKSLGSTRRFAIVTSSAGAGGDSVSPFYRKLFYHLDVRVHEMDGLLNLKFSYLKNPKRGSERELSVRDQVLWQKLRVWQLDEFYDKVVLLDTDLVLLKPVDELFSLPELSGCAMIDPGEKIIFYNYSSLETPSDLGYDDYWKQRFVSFSRQGASRTQLETLVGTYGLNSGVVVLQPNSRTFRELVSAVQRIPQRTCCPTQEFVYRFFAYPSPDQKDPANIVTRRFHPIPDEYNVRRWPFLPPEKKSALKKSAKIYHFVEKDKPWLRLPGSSNSAPNEAWLKSFCLNGGTPSASSTYRETWYIHLCKLWQDLSPMAFLRARDGVMEFKSVGS